MSRSILHWSNTLSRGHAAWSRRVWVVAAVTLPLIGGSVAVALGQGSLLAQGLVSGLLLGGVYSLVAIGLALILGVLDIINFAHGSLMTLAMYTTFLLVTSAGMNPYLSIVVTIPLLFALGLLVQRFLLNHIMSQPTENQLLLTLGLSLLIENGLLVVFTGTPRAIQVNMGGAVNIFSAVADWPHFLAFAGSLALCALIYLALQRTLFGTAIRAVAQNPQGAALSGINVRWMYMLAFGLGVACVGAAGTLVLPFLSVDPSTGEQFNIIAFVVVVLGGLGNVAGALAGGLIIGLVQELAAAFVPNVNPMVFVFAIFVLILLFRPQGIFGRRL